MDLFRDIFGTGLTRSQKMKRSFSTGIGLGSYNAALDAAMIGFQVSRAGRGGIASAIIGQSITIAAGIPVSGFASAAISLIPGIGPFAAAFMGEILANYAEFRFGSALIKKVRVLTDINKNIRHLEMGGNYQDTESSQRQRFIAIQDMNAATIPGRRYLGQEALLMHR